MVNVLITIPDTEKLQVDDVNDALKILCGRNTGSVLSVKIKTPPFS